MKDVDELVGQLAIVHDHELAGASSGQEADALLASLQAGAPASKPRPRRPWRLRLALGTVGAAAIIAGAVVVAPGLFEEPSPAYANSAVDIRREGDWWVATIKDGLAKPEKFNEAFETVGLDVTVRAVPASPSRVGAVIQSRGPGMGIVGDDDQCEPGKVCTLRIIDGAEEYAFDLGREAKPGENYVNSDSDVGTYKGEALEGLDLRDGLAVKEVMAEVDKRGLRAEFTFMKFVKGVSGHWPRPISADRVGPDWIAYSAYPVKKGVVRLSVSPKRLPGYQNPNGAPCPKDNPGC